MTDNNVSVQVQHPTVPLSHHDQFLNINMDQSDKYSLSIHDDVDHDDDDDEDQDTTSTDGSEELQSSLCKKCNLPINEGHAYELGDDHWHTYCFKCSKCDKLLGVQSNFLVLGTGALVCSSCSYSCKNCGKKIDDLAILTGDQAYCSSCFCCRSCKRKIEDLRYARTSKGLFCMPCHERLLEKKRKQDAQKKALLKQQEEQNNTRSRSLDRRSIVTSEMLDKNLPEIPFDSISSSSSNVEVLMTPQFSKETLNTKNNSSSKEDQLDVILDIPVRSPQRNNPTTTTTLEPPVSIENTMSNDDNKDTITKQSLQVLKSPTQRFVPLSPQNAANRKAVVMDSSSQKIDDLNDPLDSNNNDDKDNSYVEMDINLDYSNSSKDPKGLNIENLGLPQQQQQQQQSEQDFITTPNKNSKNFKFGSSGTPKSPTKEKISQGITRSMSIRSPKNFFHRHKRSISGSLDLSNSNSKTTLPPTTEEPTPATTAAYRTPPIPSDPKFSTSTTATGASHHVKAISDTSNLEFSNLHTQTELELRTLRAEIHNMTAIKTSLKNEIETLSAEKAKLNLEISDQRKQLDILKNDKSSIYSSKLQSSSSSSVLNDYLKANNNNSSSSTSNNGPPPPPPPQIQPRSSSSNNLNEDTIVQVEDVAELKQPRQKPRFWRRPKLSKTKDLIISSPSNYNISKDLDDSFNSFNSEENIITNSNSSNNNNNNNKMMPKFLQSSTTTTNTSSNSPVRKLDPRELFGVALELRCQYEKSQTPFIINKCIEQIENNGLETEGIYRISGGSLLVEKLEIAFKEFNGESSLQLKNLNELMDQDINAVSSVLKRYLRKLPNPIIPYEYYSSFIELNSLQPSSIQIEQAKFLINKLPDLNVKNLTIILEHLLKIFQHSNVNKMTLKNISVVFGPTLMRDVNPEREIIDMGSRTSVLEFILDNFNDIFIR